MDDEAILTLYRQRNSSAVAETETKYGRLCLSVANNILSSREDSEECVNDTWLHAWNAIPPEWPLHFGAWLSRVTRNLAVSRLREARAQKRGGGELPLVMDELAELNGLNVPNEDQKLNDQNAGHTTADIGHADGSFS